MAEPGSGEHRSWPIGGFGSLPQAKYRNALKISSLPSSRGHVALHPPAASSWALDKGCRLLFFVLFWFFFLSVVAHGMHGTYYSWPGINWSHVPCTWLTARNTYFAPSSSKATYAQRSAPHCQKGKPRMLYISIEILVILQTRTHVTEDRGISGFLNQFFLSWHLVSYGTAPNVFCCFLFSIFAIKFFGRSLFSSELSWHYSDRLSCVTALLENQTWALSVVNASKERAGAFRTFSVYVSQVRRQVKEFKSVRHAGANGWSLKRRHRFISKCQVLQSGFAEPTTPPSVPADFPQNLQNVSFSRKGPLF